MPESQGPSAFSEILNSPERPLVVGGQAVNIWAEYFAPRNTRIAAQRPFVSKDADIFGDRALAQKLADAAGWEIKFFHEPRTIAVAVLIKQRVNAETLTVEVLREVRGLTRKELADADAVELRPGQIYRIPSPIRLLKAKLANLREIVPVRAQDIHHAHLLVTLVPDYLQDQHAAVITKQLPERAFVNALHELRTLITAPRARTAASRHGIALTSALPVDLSTTGLSKLAAFYRHHGTNTD
ncbi:MAG: hypothetical protein ABIY47_17120 [Opitutaceae bacterium]